MPNERCNGSFECRFITCPWCSIGRQDEGDLQLFLCNIAPTSSERKLTQQISRFPPSHCSLQFICSQPPRVLLFQDSGLICSLEPIFRECAGFCLVKTCTRAIGLVLEAFPTPFAGVLGMRARANKGSLLWTSRTICTRVVSLGRLFSSSAPTFPLNFRQAS